MKSFFKLKKMKFLIYRIVINLIYTIVNSNAEDFLESFLSLDTFFTIVSLWLIIVRSVSVLIHNIIFSIKNELD